jgi:hypothetical protein
MDATPNYGFVIPVDPGTDLMDADLWRTPITQIDTKLKVEENARVAADTATNANVTSNTTALTNKVTAAGGLVGKRMAVTHYGGGTTDANGFMTVNHNCGFTPSCGFCINKTPSSNFPIIWGIDSYGATQVRLRFINASAGGPASSLPTGNFSILFVE